MTSCSYNINFSDYFHIPRSECNIIYDTDKIKDILFTHNTLSVYPNHLDLNPIDFMNKNNKNLNLKIRITNDLGAIKIYY